MRPRRSSFLPLIEVDGAGHHAPHVLPAEVGIVALIEPVLGFVEKEAEIRTLGIEDLTATRDELRLCSFAEAVAQADVCVPILKPGELPRYPSGFGVHRERESPCNAAPTEVRERVVIENLHGHSLPSTRGFECVVKVEVAQQQPRIL